MYERARQTGGGGVVVASNMEGVVIMQVYMRVPCSHTRTATAQVEFHNSMVSVTRRCQNQCAKCWGGGKPDVAQVTAPLLSCYALCTINPERMLEDMCP